MDPVSNYLKLDRNAENQHVTGTSNIGNPTTTASYPKETEQKQEPEQELEQESLPQSQPPITRKTGPHKTTSKKTQNQLDICTSYSLQLDAPFKLGTDLAISISLTIEFPSEVVDMVMAGTGTVECPGLAIRGNG
ncbi:unnamed protein product [Penicillium viridicatum]